MEDVKVVIKTKCGEGGRLFGSITSKDIAEETKKQTGLVIDKKKIQLSSPIRNIGKFDIKFPGVDYNERQIPDSICYGITFTYNANMAI